MSHDREFLDRQVNKVLALELEGVRAYAGGVTAYRQWRVEEEARLTAAARKQQDKRDQLETFIERFGAKATKAAQAKSKQKLLDKMETVETLEERATVRFRFAEAPRSGREVLRLDGVAKSFGARTVYRDLTATVARGDRIGVIGPNGAGKSTLLKLAAGALAPDRGTVKPGHGVVMGYYAQHLLEPGGAAAGSLDPRATILETLWALAPDRGEAWIRAIAGGFLFSGDDVTKPIGVLSGGERARVALAKLLLVPANLLLLDEPTNHLDLDSSEALIEALRGFPGTLLFVSHNRTFVNALATVIWEVKDGAIIPCPGNLDDWLYHQRQLEEAAGGAPEAGARGAGGTGRRRAGRRAGAEAGRGRGAQRPLPAREAAARRAGHGGGEDRGAGGGGPGGGDGAGRPGHLPGLRPRPAAHRAQGGGRAGARRALRGVGAAGGAAGGRLGDVSAPPPPDVDGRRAGTAVNRSRPTSARPAPSRSWAPA